MSSPTTAAASSAPSSPPRWSPPSRPARCRRADDPEAGDGDLGARPPRRDPLRAGQHAWLAGIPLVLGLAHRAAARLARRRATSWLRATLLTTTGLLYTIPSLALFILLPIILNRGILDPVNVIVAMTIYTVALLTRTVADGLSASTRPRGQAAIAMGYGGFARFRRPSTCRSPYPCIAAGLRVAAVSNVSIVSVASLIGVSQLGYFLTDGYARAFPTEVWVGIVACVVLAHPLRPRDPRGLAGPDAVGPRRWPRMIDDIDDLAHRPGALDRARRHPGRLTEHLLYTGITHRHRPADRRPARRVGRAHRPAALARHRRQRPARGAQPRTALRRLDARRAAHPEQPRLHVIPSIIVLVLLAVPPMLSGTYAGIESVDPAARDAARGMGMRGSQVLTAGRAAVRHAPVPLGLAQRDPPGHRHRDHRGLDQPRRAGPLPHRRARVTRLPQMVGGSMLVAALALVADLLLAGVQRTPSRRESRGGPAC